MASFNLVRGWFSVGVFAAAIAVGGCAAGPRGVAAADGIANFGQVNDRLWRGAQPDARGFEALRRRGVTTIINLRMADDVWPVEAPTLRRLGLGYVQVPLHGFSAPTPAEVARVMALLESSPGPVFVHCEHGADRTGTIVACYRIRREGWTAEQALTEARRYGLSEWEFGMKRFVREYARVGAAAP